MNPRKPYRVPLPDGRVLDLGPRTLVMGIVNVTPDSFADGGLHFAVDDAVAAGLQMARDGADIIDVGGESTRPGAAPVSADEELRRVLPVVEQLASRTEVPLSIDTYRAVVAREAVARGATIINDISGLQYEPALGRVAAETGAAIVLMHMRGRPSDMYERAVYTDPAREVGDELAQAIARAAAAGIDRDMLVIDPGLGFAKRAAHSYDVLAHLERIVDLDRPILVGPSRKSFLTKPLGERRPDARDWGTAAAVTASILFGAHIVRVHNVPAMVDVARVADTIRGHPI